MILICLLILDEPNGPTWQSSDGQVVDKINWDADQPAQGNCTVVDYNLQRYVSILFILRFVSSIFTKLMISIYLRFSWLGCKIFLFNSLNSQLKESLYDIKEISILVILILRIISYLSIHLHTTEIFWTNKKFNKFGGLQKREKIKK